MFLLDLFPLWPHLVFPLYSFSLQLYCILIRLVSFVVPYYVPIGSVSFEVPFCVPAGSVSIVASFGVPVGFVHFVALYYVLVGSVSFVALDCAPIGSLLFDAYSFTKFSRIEKIVIAKLKIDCNLFTVLVL